MHAGLPSSILCFPHCEEHLSNLQGQFEIESSSTYMAITKRPCANCPFRSDGAGIPLNPGRLTGIVQDLIDDDLGTFVCHKTLGTEPKTCAGAVAVMSKLDRLPVIARLGMIDGVIDAEDIQASAAMVIDPPKDINCKYTPASRPPSNQF